MTSAFNQRTTKRDSATIYVPHRGDIVWLDFDPQAGHEQAGRRPAIVLSHRDYNSRTRLAIICPITSQYKPYPFIVPLPEHTLPKPSYVLADQVKSLDWSKRNIALITHAPRVALEQITAFAVGIVQGLG
jgi:mRNA interferase MazF